MRQEIWIDKHSRDQEKKSPVFDIKEEHRMNMEKVTDQEKKVFLKRCI